MQLDAIEHVSLLWLVCGLTALKARICLTATGKRSRLVEFLTHRPPPCLSFSEFYAKMSDPEPQPLPSASGAAPAGASHHDAVCTPAPSREEEVVRSRSFLCLLVDHLPTQHAQVKRRSGAKGHPSWQTAVRVG